MQNDILPLLHKYDVPLPRYTSYPTVPYWNSDSFSVPVWLDSVRSLFNDENGEICIYIHLPFCEDLCTYCACNKRITKNHKVETPYLKSVLKEWEMYRSLFPTRPVIREIHLGGGTPTFFSPQNLLELINGITEGCDIAESHEFSIEVHPNNTTLEHLKVLRSVGFNRISVGVQDFDPTVQYIIHRQQSFEQTKRVIDWARQLGYESVNVDLIYGLPKQTLESITSTINYVNLLKPDRIAFYSYAHVPWKSKGQRRYTDDDVPKADLKLDMYNLGNSLLTAAGFESIGMDHFALPTDKLMIAFESGKLHRNFMGYTTTNHKLVIGLGASSISDTWSSFAQNEKSVEEYQLKVDAGQFPIVNGHHLSELDLIIREHILNLMCNGKTTFKSGMPDEEIKDQAFEKWKSFEDDDLLIMSGDTIEVTPKGRLFVRNISAVLDQYLQSETRESGLFSKAI